MPLTVTGLVIAMPWLNVAKTVTFTADFMLTEERNAALAGTVSVWRLLVPNVTLPLAVTLAELVKAVAAY